MIETTTRPIFRVCSNATKALSVESKGVMKGSSDPREAVKYPLKSAIEDLVDFSLVSCLPIRPNA